MIFFFLLNLFWLLDITEIFPNEIMQIVFITFFGEDESKYSSFSIRDSMNSIFGMGFSGYYLLWPWIKMYQYKRKYIVQNFILDDQYAYIQTIVNNLATKARIPFPKLIVTNNTEPFSSTFGFRSHDTYIIVSTKMIQILEEDEMEAVIAHEITHVISEDYISHIHTVLGKQSPIKFLIAGLVVMFVGSLILYYFILGTSTDIFFWFLSLTLSLTIPVMLVIGLKTMMLADAYSARKDELYADQQAVMLTGNPDILMSALYKINDENQHIHLKNKTNSNNKDINSNQLHFQRSLHTKNSPLWNIINFNSHPSIEERINHIKHNNQEKWCELVDCDFVDENKMLTWINDKLAFEFAKTFPNQPITFIEKLYATFGDKSLEFKATGFCRTGVALRKNKKYLHHAKTSFLAAIPCCRQASRRDLEAYCLINLGNVYIALDQRDQAVFYLKEAVIILRELGYNMKEKYVLEEISSLS